MLAVVLIVIIIIFSLYFLIPTSNFTITEEETAPEETPTEETAPGETAAEETAAEETPVEIPPPQPALTAPQMGAAPPKPPLPPPGPSLLEKQRIERERAERERAERERAERDRVDRDRYFKELRERAQRESRLERQRVAKERADRERVERERVAKERYQYEMKEYGVEFFKRGEMIPGFLNNSEGVYASAPGELFNTITGLTRVPLPVVPTNDLLIMANAVPDFIAKKYPQFIGRYNYINVFGDGGFRLLNIPPDFKFPETLPNENDKPGIALFKFILGERGKQIRVERERVERERVERERAERERVAKEREKYSILDLNGYIDGDGWVYVSPVGAIQTNLKSFNDFSRTLNTLNTPPYVFGEEVNRYLENNAPEFVKTYNYINYDNNGRFRLYRLAARPKPIRDPSRLVIALNKDIQTLDKERLEWVNANKKASVLTKDGYIDANAIYVAPASAIPTGLKSQNNPSVIVDEINKYLTKNAAQFLNTYNYANYRNDGRFRLFRLASRPKTIPDAQTTSIAYG
jgi:hypothetical protein